jgi:hypothetical protein
VWCAVPALDPTMSTEFIGGFVRRPPEFRPPRNCPWGPIRILYTSSRYRIFLGPEMRCLGVRIARAGAHQGGRRTRADDRPHHGVRGHAQPGAALSLTDIGCHSLGIYTVILRSSLSFPAAMTVPPAARHGLRLHDR